ncbi:hypothetical protein Pfo_000434 [Paulownia fortunei]|nr:hypothetical protein Pfo_000434 [Paulownia fortunei]
MEEGRVAGHKSHILDMKINDGSAQNVIKAALNDNNNPQDTLTPDAGPSGIQANDKIDEINGEVNVEDLPINNSNTEGRTTVQQKIDTVNKHSNEVRLGEICLQNRFVGLLDEGGDEQSQDIPHNSDQLNDHVASCDDTNIELEIGQQVISMSPSMVMKEDEVIRHLSGQWKILQPCLWIVAFRMRVKRDRASHGLMAICGKT